MVNYTTYFLLYVHLILSLENTNFNLFIDFKLFSCCSYAKVSNGVSTCRGLNSVYFAHSSAKFDFHLLLFIEVQFICFTVSFFHLVTASQYMSIHIQILWNRVLVRGIYGIRDKYYDRGKYRVREKYCEQN